MFIIERALNIFTLIHDMEAQINMKEPQLGKVKLGGSILTVNPTLDNTLNRPFPENPSFVPNQLILNNALINAIKQNSDSNNISDILNEKERVKSFEETSEKIPSFSVADSKNMSLGEHKSAKDQPKTVLPLELSKIVSPNQSSRTNNQQSFVSALSSPCNNYNTSQSSDSLANERLKDMPVSSPRFVRINSNLVDHTLNTHRVIVPNSAIINKTTNQQLSSSSTQIYNNINIQGGNKRTVWPNSNLITNARIGEPIASPISSSKNSFTPGIQQIHSPIGSNLQINPNFRYTVTPNPSVARYIEKNIEGFSSPIGFSPLASPTYRKNVAQNKSGHSPNTVTVNPILNSQFYNYKN